MNITFVVIILVCLCVIYAQMYIYGLAIDQAYERGYKKGLNTKVVRVSELNEEQ